MLIEHDLNENLRGNFRKINQLKMFNYSHVSPRFLGLQAFPFECNLCILNFATRIQRNEHIKNHFKRKYCINCEKSLIQIGDNWYELKLHIDDENCNNVEKIKDDLDEISVKVEETQSNANDSDEIDISSNHPEDSGHHEELIPLDDILQVSNSMYVEDIKKESNEEPASIEEVSIPQTVFSKEIEVCDIDKVISATESSEPRGADANEENLRKIDKEKRQRKKKTYMCDVCGKVFKSKYNQDVHRTTHTNDYPISCDICQRPFKYKELLTRHMAVHTGARRQQCEFCDRTFSSKLGLKNHILITHEGKTLYSCEICGKTFASNGNLRNHNRIHLETRPYICNYCGRGFNSQCNLNEHLNIHTGARPYTCQVCGKNFGRDSQRRAHMLIHSGKKPCKCEFEGCDRAYTYSIDLKRHRYSVHGIYTKKHICPICSKVYPENKLLKKHLESHNLVAKT